jgi:hypothetical protein
MTSKPPSGLFLYKIHWTDVLSKISNLRLREFVSRFISVLYSIA